MWMFGFNVPDVPVLMFGFLRLRSLVGHVFTSFILRPCHSGHARGLNSQHGVGSHHVGINGLHAGDFRIGKVGMEVNRQADRLTQTEKENDDDPSGEEIRCEHSLHVQQDRSPGTPL
jgi:hypothetical protein